MKTRIERKAHRLHEPVDNPKPDGRVKRDFSTKGQSPTGIYRVETVYREFDGHELPPETRIKKHGLYGALDSNTDPERTKLLMEHLVPEEGTLDALRATLDSFDTMLLDIVRELVDNDKLAVEDIEEAHRTLWERED